MNYKKINTEEKEFLSSYNINSYSRPSIATDIALFSTFAKESEYHRKDAEPELSILLIKRGEHPFKDCWALPGGFLRETETIEECAIRELKEETGITPSTIFQTGIFSSPSRDPRGRIVSLSYTAIVTEENVKATSGGDASEAKWFSVSFVKNQNNLYTLKLTREDETLTAELNETDIVFENLKYEIVSNKGLAFDHAKIIANAITTLKIKAENPSFVFNFLPEKFTLASMLRVNEILLGKPLLVANYRRKISDMVVEEDEYTEGAGHRPARLFRKK